MVVGLQFATRCAVIVGMFAAALALTRAVPVQRAATSAPVADRERQVLIDLFELTNGQGWTNREGWGTSQSVCEWYGVQCDFVGGDLQRPIVTGLLLEMNDLRAKLPATLANLEHLHVLDVAGNHLTGAAPEQLLQRWDKHQLEFGGKGNSFSNFVTRARVEYSSSGTLCVER